MARTIFDTPVISPIIRLCSLVAFRLIGWKAVGDPHQADKYVLIAEPHTSNVDVPLMMAASFILRLKLHWIGKETLFVGWKGPIIRWIGGLPISRAGGENEVARVARLFEGREKLALAIAPQGTRAHKDKWRTGFYWIAVGANVPVLTGFLDYKTRRAGVGPLFHPTGNVEEDIQDMRKFYAGMVGRNPERQ